MSTELIIEKTDFYQSIDNLTLDLYTTKPLPDVLKSLKAPLEKDLVKYDESTQSLVLKFDIDGYSIDYSLKLAHPISKIANLSIGFKKFEVSLIKADNSINWKHVEYKENQASIDGHLFNTSNIIDSSTNKLKQPYTSKVDWSTFNADETPELQEDKVAEEEDENAFFQKIFKDATDDQKKAMIKSMQESSGTVLSTDWDKVKENPVEPNLPDGAEFTSR
ncbi:co-chaperone [Hanseniaspora uvarum]|nr:co-chaperone [Hanseniaspora uvarum]